MDYKKDTPNEGAQLRRELFGFLWDFRERAVNLRSFWYGYFSALCVYKVVFAVYEWKLPSPTTIAIVLAFTVIGKWMQATHPLK